MKLSDGLQSTWGGFPGEVRFQEPGNAGEGLHSPFSHCLHVDSPPLHPHSNRYLKTLYLEFYETQGWSIFSWAQFGTTPDSVSYQGMVPSVLKCPKCAVDIIPPQKDPEKPVLFHCCRWARLLMLAVGRDLF